MRHWCAVAIVALACPWTASSAVQQSSAEPQPPAERQSPPERKPVIETAAMRLNSARNILVYRSRGSEIPFDVIRSTMEGWGRFAVVETREKADLIVEISSTGDSSVQVSSSSHVSPDSGKEEKSTSSRKDLSPTEIRMTVIDARNKRPLWSGAESVKFAVKEKSKENNLVEAAERLAQRFHERLEPSLAK